MKNKAITITILKSNAVRVDYLSSFNNQSISSVINEILSKHFSLQIEKNTELEKLKKQLADQNKIKEMLVSLSMDLHEHKIENRSFYSKFVKAIVVTLNFLNDPVVKSKMLREFKQVLPESDYADLMNVYFKADTKS